jgi:RNA-directed DNA polymerase
LKKSRSLPLREIIATLRRKLLGHWNYYGVNRQLRADRELRLVCEEAAVYKWLNRRSQRKSFTVTSFVAAWERWEIPVPASSRNRCPIPR